MISLATVAVGPSDPGTSLNPLPRMKTAIIAALSLLAYVGGVYGASLGIINSRLCMGMGSNYYWCSLVLVSLTLSKTNCCCQRTIRQ